MVKKRSESQLLTACLNLLQCYENSKCIKHCDRLNSGRVFLRGRLIRLCREGTPDGYFIMNNGHVVWIETKTSKGKLSESQEKFKDMISNLNNHTYIEVRSTDEIEEFLKSNIGGDDANGTNNNKM